MKILPSQNKRFFIDVWKSGYMKRRELIYTLCSLSSVTVAGCTSAETDNLEEDSNDSPEGVVNSYLQAINNQNVDELEQITHNDSSLKYNREEWSIEYHIDIPEENITIKEIRREKIEDLDWITEGEHDHETELIDGEIVKDSIEELLNEIGANDFVIVFVRTESNNNNDVNNHYYYLVKQEQWRLWEIAKEPIVFWDSLL